MEETSIGDLRGVSEIPPDYILYLDSQDVDSLAPYFPRESRALLDYQSFYVRAEEGEILEIWGMEGIIPFLWKSITRVL